MNPTLTEGLLYSKQTVLAFNAHPPSPFGSRDLPQSICEARGGEKRFAMNRNTQLQFNLGVIPNPANLATNFDPNRVSPVIIEKVGGKTIGLSHTPVHSFRSVSAEKLALAIRLAKRDIQQGRHHLGVAQTETTQTNNAHGHDSECANEGLEAKPTNVQVYTDHIPTMVALMDTPLQQDNRTLPDEVHVHATKSVSKKLQPNSKLQNELQCENAVKKNKPSDDSQLDPLASEIARLRSELRNQVVKLRHLTKMSERRDHVTMTSSSVRRGKGRSQDKGRAWWEEEEGEQEREQRRKEEQNARNSRMVYNLSQQVSGLQKDLDRLELYKTPGHVKHTKKSLAIQRLAAVHRAALRTLQGFSGRGTSSSQSLPPELGLLVQQLSLLSSQLMGGADDTETDTAIQQLMDAVVERQALQDKENVLRPPSKTADIAVAKGRKQKPNKQPDKRKAKKAGSKNAGVLLDSHLKSQRKKLRVQYHGFTQPTFSSHKRQQPNHIYTPTTQHSSTPYSEGRGRSRLLTPRPCHLDQSINVVPSPSPLHKHTRHKTPGHKQTKKHTSLSPHQHKDGRLKSPRHKPTFKPDEMSPLVHSPLPVDNPDLPSPPQTHFHPSLSQLQPSHPPQVQLQLSHPPQAQLQPSHPPQAQLQPSHPSLAQLQPSHPPQVQLQPSHPPQAQLQPSHPSLAQPHPSHPPQPHVHFMNEESEGESNIVTPSLEPAADDRMWQHELGVGAQNSQQSAKMKIGRDAHNLHQGGTNLQPKQSSNLQAMPGASSQPMPVSNSQAMPEASMNRNQTADSLLAGQPDLLAMLQRLEELEGEEELIREKWVTIAFEDPLKTVSNATTLVQPQQQESPKPLPPLPASSQASVAQYRERYQHYLKSTGLTTQGGFDPWKMAESIADEMVEEMLEQVAGELGVVCDSCVDGLYSEEFQTPQ